jgi:hypothetical protein
MKLKIILPILVIILLIFVGVFLFFNKNILSPNSNSCQIETSKVTPVSLELAKSVATLHVHSNNKPYNWSYVGNYVVYNSLGDINYYLLIFRKSEFISLDTLEKLEQNANLFSDSDNDQKYQFENLATVMVAAMKEDGVVKRHYRGIPEPIAEKLKIEKKYGTVSNLISDSPMGNFYYSIEGDKIVKVLDHSVNSLSELKKLSEDSQKRKEEGYARLSKDDCERYQKAITEAEQAHIEEWNKFG